MSESASLVCSYKWSSIKLPASNIIPNGRIMKPTAQWFCKGIDDSYRSRTIKEEIQLQKRA